MFTWEDLQGVFTLSGESQRVFLLDKLHTVLVEGVVELNCGLQKLYYFNGQVGEKEL